MSARRAWLAAGIAAVVAAGAALARQAQDRDPVARKLAKTDARIDGIAALLAGIYQSEGIPLPHALSPRPSRLAAIRHLHVIRSERAAGRSAG